MIEAPSIAFGSNAPKFDDGKIKYFASKESFYIMSAVTERDFLFMSVSLDNKLIIGLSNLTQPTPYYNNPIYSSKVYLRKALSLYQEQLAEGLEHLFKAARHRINRVIFKVDDDRSFMLFKVLLYQGGLKPKLVALGYRIRWEDTGENSKDIIIERSKEQTKNET